MKKIVSIFIGVLAAVFILAGCSDLLNKPASPADGRGVVTVTIGVGKNARTLLPGKEQFEIDSVDLLKQYLSMLPPNDAANAYPAVKVNVNLDTEWNNILDVLDSADGRYVELDFSSSTGMTTFNPGTADTGEKKIVSLTVPVSCRAISDVAVAPDNYSPALFQYFTSLKSISGAGITRVGAGAFKGTYMKPNGTLESYNFDALQSIGDYAFYRCGGLNGTLIIPDSVTTIGKAAFSECRNLIGDLDIPDKVTDISHSAFQNCSGLNGTLTIPDGVKSIGQFAFQGCSNLTGNLDLPNGIEKIMACAFEGCIGLTGSVTIPAGVTSIGNYAFSGCGKLTGLIIPENVTAIDAYAFQNCKGLTGTLNIPDKVTTIGAGAFSGCKLTGLTLGSSVQTIGASAFSGIAADDNCLTEVLTIPAGVTRIDTKAFSHYKADTVIIAAAGLVYKTFIADAFPGNLQSKYVASYPVGAGGPGTYKITGGTAAYPQWTKQ